MTRAKDEIEAPVGVDAGRDLWRRCRSIEAPESDSDRFLDLAAFADGILDEEEYDRIAERLAADPAARSDVAAARALSVGGIAMPGGIEPIIARAIAILPEVPVSDRLTTAPLPPGGRAVLQAMAQWGSLAAAIAFTSWLGFAMGRGTSLTMIQPGPVSQISDENFLPDMLDPSTGFLRDLGIGQQT